MFLDFLNTLENLRKGTRMNKEFVKLLSERKNDAEVFFADLIGFRNELRKKVKDLGTLIDLKEHQHIEQSSYRGTMSLSDALIYNIRISGDLLVSIDTYVDPQGWGIYIWPRHGDRSKLRSLLRQLEIPTEEEGEGFGHPADFDYDENLEEISPVLQELTDKIATSQERGEAH